MSMVKNVSNQIVGWIGMAITIVIGSIVLLKFKAVDGAACSGLYTFNASANNCYLTSNASQTTSISGVGTVVDSFVSAIAEPQNWVAIAIIAIIGIAILGMFLKLFNRKG